MKYKSASAQIVNFLKGKELGYEFTVEQLKEDLNTTPGEEPITSDGAFNGCMSKQRKAGALTAKAILGPRKRSTYVYTLVDHNKLYAMDRSSVGSKAGRKFAKPITHDLHIGDSQGKLFNSASVEELKHGVLPPATQLGNDPVPDGQSANAGHVSVSDEVKYHLRKAFIAYKRQFLADKVLLSEASTNDLMAELQRRLDAKRERDAEKAAR